MADKLVIIVPCYNENDILNDTAHKLFSVLEQMINNNVVSNDSRICFIDDGSVDGTDKIVENLCSGSKYFSAISLVRNFGHQNALIAGMNEIEADVYISIDADLQDDPESIFEMVQMYNSGFDVVYGVREERETDTYIKRVTANLYYQFLSLIGVDVVSNHADFRLLSSKAVSKLNDYKEKDVMLRLLIPKIGLKSTKVFYPRKRREKGKTKYSFLKMCSFAWTGITGVSIFPVRMISLVGILLIMLSFSFLFKNIMYFLFPFFSGLIIVSIGIVGEYVGKVLVETKNRPRYQVDKKINL